MDGAKKYEKNSESVVNVDGICGDGDGQGDFADIASCGCGENGVEDGGSNYNVEILVVVIMDLGSLVVITVVLVWVVIAVMLVLVVINVILMLVVTIVV